MQMSPWKSQLCHHRLLENWLPRCCRQNVATPPCLQPLSNGARKPMANPRVMTGVEAMSRSRFYSRPLQLQTYIFLHSNFGPSRLYRLSWLHPEPELLVLRRMRLKIHYAPVTLADPDHGHRSNKSSSPWGIHRGVQA